MIVPRSSPDAVPVAEHYARSSNALKARGSVRASPARLVVDRLGAAAGGGRGVVRSGHAAARPRRRSAIAWNRLTAMAAPARQDRDRVRGQGHRLDPVRRRSRPCATASRRDEAGQRLAVQRARRRKLRSRLRDREQRAHGPTSRGWRRRGRTCAGTRRPDEWFAPGWPTRKRRRGRCPICLSRSVTRSHCRRSARAQTMRQWRKLPGSPPSAFSDASRQVARTRPNVCQATHQAKRC